MRRRVETMAAGLSMAAAISAGLQNGLLSAFAALAAYLPTQMLGLREGFWAAITAIAVIQNEFGKTRMMARDQFAGAIIGGLIGLVVIMVTGQHLASYALAVVLAMLACWMLGIPTSARLAAITTTIILLVPHEGTAESMMVSRIVEVGWGVTVAILTALAWHRIRAVWSDPEGEEAKE